MYLRQSVLLLTVFAASPTLKSDPETIAPTAETASTLVNQITPTGVVIRRITCSVAGSLISARNAFHVELIAGLKLL